MLGEPDPDKLAASMSSSQLMRWSAFLDCEPWLDRGATLVASMVANVNLNTEARVDPFVPEEFLRYPKDHEKEALAVMNRLQEMSNA